MVKEQLIQQKTNERKANIYLKEFIKTISISASPSNSQPQAVLQIIDDKNKVTLSKFKEEYLSYCGPIESSKYLISINLSFKQFNSVVGDYYLDEITSINDDQFIIITFERTQRGAHHYLSHRLLWIGLPTCLLFQYYYCIPGTKFVLLKQFL